MACSDGAPSAPEPLWNSTSRLRIAGSRSPQAMATAISVVTTAWAPSVVRNTRRRSKRSARSPPIGEHKPCGANVAAAISAVESALPLVAATSEPIAASCTQVPMSDAAPAPQNNRKARWRSGRIPGGSTWRHASDSFHERLGWVRRSFVTPSPPSGPGGVPQR